VECGRGVREDEIFFILSGLSGGVPQPQCHRTRHN
jgi:hypothetical protein